MGSEAEVWRPIETAPRDGTFVLVWCAEHACHYICRWKEGRGSYPDGMYDKDFGHVFATAWTPLPEPPR